MALNQDVAFKITADVQGQQAVDKLAESLKRMGTQGEMSAKQTVAAMRMVPAQLTDIATQLAGGQSPFLIMMQQGGQLRDMFGSISGALIGVGRTLATILTPINMVGAALAGIAFAAYKGADQSAELNKQLLLTGGAAGYTAGQIEKMARVLSDTQGVAAGTARELTTGLAASGQFVGKNLDLAAEAAARLQKLSGQSSDEIVKDFAKMSGGVAAWAAEHNKQFNYLSVAQFQHIKQLEEMGRKEEAMRANIEALDKAMEGRKRSLGYLEEAWSSLGKAASWAWDKMLGIGREKTPEEEIDTLTKFIQNREKMLREVPTVQRNIDAQTDFGKKFQKELQDARTRLAELQKVTDDAQKEATQKATAAAQIRQKIEEDQSGKLLALQNANRSLELERLKGASEKRIAILEQEGQRVENQYRAGLITEESYNAEKLDIAKRVLNERMKLAEQEMAIENARRPNGKADAVQQQTRLQAMRNQMAKLSAEATQAELKAEGDRAEFLKKMQDAVDKFNLAQDERIHKIYAEADAVGMSVLEQKKLTEVMRINKEAAEAMIGVDEERKKKILEAAEAQKKAIGVALEYADAQAKSWKTGAKQAVNEYVENMQNAAARSKEFFTRAFKSMEDAMVEFVKTGKINFTSLTDSIISDLIRMAVQQQIMKPLMDMMKGSDFGSSIASFFGFANGGIMTAAGSLPLNTYANGGIANRPQMAIFGEGKTPEAFVPLPDGRSIPVSMRGNTGGGNVTVNVVNNAGNSKASTQERQDGNGNRIIDVVIEQVKASIASDISRGVGTVTSALERTYGANRAAGAY